jgi:hypothetical protein
MMLGEDAYNPKGKLRPILELAQKKKAPEAGITTIRTWYVHYLLYGETMAETALWDKTLGISRNHVNEEFWNESDTESLRKIVTEQPYLFLDEIRDLLAYETTRWWHPSTIWNKLNDELNMSLQVVSLLAKQRDEQERRAFKESIERFLVHVNQLVFLDETHKDRNAACRHRHWSPKGKSPFMKERFHEYNGKRYSMIAACNVEGFIHSTVQCFSREPDAYGKCKTIDSKVFMEWVITHLLPVLTPYHEFGPNSIVVLDNASIHHNDELVELIETRTGAKVIYSAPYSPDMNPIELMFGQYKKALRRNYGRDFAEAHIIALDSITPKIAYNFFHKAGIPGCDALSEEETDLHAMTVFVHQMHIHAVIPLLRRNI